MLNEKQLDYHKTKHKILKLVRKYERCLTRLEVNAQPKITPTYRMEVAGSSYDIHSKVENAVTYNLEDSKSDYDFIQRVHQVINAMKIDYRIIIIESFFESRANIDIAEKIGLGLSQFSIKKRIAIELFAYGMRCEVFKQ